MEKVNFVVSQILATMQLLGLKNSSFNKRALGRYALIRIKDFIGLARVINNKRRISPQKKRDIKDQLNALSSLYDEFLQKQRDKFSGHMQDLDLLERHNLWLEIDFDKLNFFANELLASYRLFDSEASYVPKIDVVDFIKDDRSEIESISRKFDIEDAPRMATDIFALTRFNTGGLIPMTGPQAKISILGGLELLVAYEAALLPAVNDVHLKLVVKALILLDIVSYLDNLYTRQVAPGALQEMDGLDEVLKKDGKYPEADEVLGRFARVFEIEITFELYRQVRNRIAAHLDETEDLQILVEELNSIEIDKLLEHYKKLQAVLRAAFQAEFTLQHLLMPVSKMNGVIAMSMQPDRPFDLDSIPKIAFDYDRSRLNDLGEYGRVLNDFFAGKSDPDETRSFFYQAFEQSEKTDTVPFNGRDITLRKAHSFLRNYLIQAQPDDVILKCLQIINFCKNGYPDQLEYILTSTFSKHCDVFIIRLNYIFQFGEILRLDDRSTIDFLKKEAECDNFYLSYHSLLSLLKIEVRNNGIRYLNSRAEAKETEIVTFIFSRLAEVSKCNQFVTSLLLLSELWFNPLLASYVAKYNVLLIERLKDIVRDSVEKQDFLPQDALSDEDVRLLSLSLEKNIFTNLFLIVADKVDGSRDGLKKFLFELIADNTMKISYRDEIFVNHLAFALFKMGRFDDAEKVFRILIERNPENPETYLNLLELFSETKNLSAYTKTRSELSGYLLSQDMQAKIAGLDSEIGFSP
jgi:hypothetical protein